MNAIYERYRNDPAFRESLIAAAHRRRNAALARLLGATAEYFSLKRKSHAAHPHLARQA